LGCLKALLERQSRIDAEDREGHETSTMPYAGREERCRNPGGWDLGNGG